MRNFEAFFWVSPRKEDEETGIEFTHAEIDWHYPDNVEATTTAYKDIANFCFPDLEKIKLETPLEESCKIENFTFTLTDQDGRRAYGVCLRFLNGGRGQRFGVERRPRHCLCFVTHHSFTSLLSQALLQVHAMSLLDASQSKAASIYFLKELYCHPVPQLGSSRNAITIPSSPAHCLFHPFQLQLAPSSLCETRSVAPLADALGLDTFFNILSAILCERRIIFIANEVDTLSKAVHAAAAMISPFHWQHVFIPLLPSNLMSYAAAPVPYIMGVRRYLLADLVKEALEDTILVDVDTGDCTAMGRGGIPPIRNIFGASGSSGSESPEKGTALNAMKNMFKGNKKQQDVSLYHREGGGSSSCDQVLSSIISELRAVWSNRPGSGNMMQKSGKSAAESSKEKWSLELNRVLESNLLLLYVYLFGDITIDYDRHSAAMSLKSMHENRGAVRNANDEFGQGDSRAAFNLKAFRMRRRNNGTTEAVELFLDDFMHSQMFERYCADWVLLQQTTNVPANALSSEGQMQKDHVFVQTCLFLRSRNLSFNVSNIRAAIQDTLRTTSSSGGSEEDIERVVSEGKFHALALKVTSNSSGNSQTSNQTSKASSGKEVHFHYGFEYGYGKGLEQDLNQICFEAATSSVQAAAVSQTIWLRLEDCKMFNWKHGLRGLQLLHCMLLQGPPGILSEALSRFSMIHSFTDYRIKDSSACSAEKRLLMRTVAHKVVGLLLDQKRLEVRRQFGNQVRCGLLPYVGLQQRLQAHALQLMQNSSSSGSKTAPSESSYVKSFKNASRRLSSLNFTKETNDFVSNHPQSISEFPLFRKRHEQYKQMMEILQVRLTTEVVGSIQESPIVARRQSMRRASFQRSLSAPEEEFCLLDLNDLETETTQPEQETHPLTTSFVMDEAIPLSDSKTIAATMNGDVDDNFGHLFDQNASSGASDLDAFGFPKVSDDGFGNFDDKHKQPKNENVNVFQNNYSNFNDDVFSNNDPFASTSSSGFQQLDDGFGCFNTSTKETNNATSHIQPLNGFGNAVQPGPSGLSHAFMPQHAPSLSHHGFHNNHQFNNNSNQQYHHHAMSTNVDPFEGLSVSGDNNTTSHASGVRPVQKKTEDPFANIVSWK